VPDISFTASGIHDPYVVISGGQAFFSGGTSASAPVFAGVLALLNEYLVGTKTQSHAGLGNINPMLYYLGQNAAAVYHDVTAGSNAVPCVPRSSPDCPASGIYGYQAGPGYDLVTGWGSIDVTRMIATWAGVLSKSSTAAESQATFRSGTGDAGADAALELLRGVSSPETSGWPVIRP
jgi:subtilase family serine protease